MFTYFQQTYYQQQSNKVEITQQRCHNKYNKYNDSWNLPKEVCDDYLKDFILLLYVDDLLITSNYVQKIDWIKKKFKRNSIS